MKRIYERLHDNFRFLKVDDYFDGSEYNGRDLASEALDESDFEAVTVPHDWAIGKDFEEDNDLSYSDIMADGIKTKIKNTGRTGALPILGTGFYRRRFTLPEVPSDARVSLIFDGIQWESEIYLNGRKIAAHHFGYLSFAVDITDSVRRDGENLLAVKATVRPDCSRWYPGSGIFRDITLLITDKDAVAYCGIRTQIKNVSREEATLGISVEPVGSPDAFEIELCAPDGTAALSGRGIFTGNKGTYSAKVESPVLWSVEHPALYTLRVTTFRGGIAADESEVRIGFRDLRFTPDKGFFLNGEHLKLQGVCNHHDLGVFGAAFNRSAARRQLEILRSFGVNALRTSHNPPAPALLDLCDEMGFLVMDEFFDEWKRPKIANGYARFFDEHADADARAIIRRDINHPSVFLWSIGNEIYEQNHEDGVEVARMLTAICHEEDATRLTTAALNQDMSAEKYGFFDAIDVIGLNYKPHHYRYFHEKYPDKVFYGSETASCVSMRDEFFLPAEPEVPVRKREDLSLSDYSLSSPAWATTADRELAEQRACPFLLGEFVWTGFDYLGEPTPYYAEWPARSSYFGIVDTSGLPKSRYYIYKSMWSRDKVLHIFPHWNFEGHEGENVPVHVATNYDHVELFVNGKSYGVQSLSRSYPNLGDNRVTTDFSDVRCCRLVFDPVIYEPGEVVAVAYDNNGIEIARTSVVTAGKPCAIRLDPERASVLGDGEDACFVRATVIDAKGNPCPTANAEIHFEAVGVGKIYATDNGDPRDDNGFAKPNRRTLGGKAVAVVVGTSQSGGKITVRATAAGLEDGVASILSLPCKEEKHD